MMGWPIFSYNVLKQALVTLWLRSFPKIFSTAELLAKTIWKSMTFQPHFAKFSTLKGYFSGFIGATGILFMYNFLQGARLSFGYNKFSKFFSAA